jgi:hypothetical protein
LKLWRLIQNLRKRYRQWRQERDEAAIAKFIQDSGGRLTDSIERQMTERKFRLFSSWPHW